MNPGYVSPLLFFLFSDSYSYRRFSLSFCRLSPSLNPQSTSFQSSDAPLRSESLDSECAIGEVAVRAIGFSGDLDLLTLEVTMATMAEPSREVARASQGMALVLSSLP